MGANVTCFLSRKRGWIASNIGRWHAPQWTGKYLLPNEITTFGWKVGKGLQEKEKRVSHKKMININLKCPTKYKIILKKLLLYFIHQDQLMKIITLIFHSSRSIAKLNPLALLPFLGHHNREFRWFVIFFASYANEKTAFLNYET